MRPITISLLGNCLLLAKHFHQPRHGRRELRTLPPPIRDPLAVDAQAFAVRGRLWIIEADALDEAPGARIARIGGDDAVEGPLLSAAAGEAYDHHDRSLRIPKSARLYAT